MSALDWLIKYDKCSKIVTFLSTAGIIGNIFAHRLCNKIKLYINTMVHVACSDMSRKITKYRE